MPWGGGQEEENRHIHASTLGNICYPKAKDLKRGIWWGQRSLGVSEREREREKSCRLVWSPLLSSERRRLLTEAARGANSWEMSGGRPTGLWFLSTSRKKNDVFSVWTSCQMSFDDGFDTTHLSARELTSFPFQWALASGWCGNPASCVIANGFWFHICFPQRGRLSS